MQSLGVVQFGDRMSNQKKVNQQGPKLQLGSLNSSRQSSRTFERKECIGKPWAGHTASCNWTCGALCGFAGRRYAERFAEQRLAQGVSKIYTTWRVMGT